jgi:hypothetical protein
MLFLQFRQFFVLATSSLGRFVGKNRRGKDFPYDNMCSLLENTYWPVKAATRIPAYRSPLSRLCSTDYFGCCESGELNARSQASCHTQVAFTFVITLHFFSQPAQSEFLKKFRYLFDTS